MRKTVKETLLDFLKAKYACESAINWVENQSCRTYK